MTLENLVSLISTITLTVTLIIMIRQTSLLRKQIEEDHEWRRREKALLFSRIYHSDLRLALKRILDCFGHIHSRESPLTSEELKKAFEDDPTIRDDVNFLLSYLENIGLAVRHNIASFDVIYDMLGSTFMKYCFVFQTYINLEQQYNPKLWSNVEWLSEELHLKRIERKETPTRLPRLG